MGRTGIRDAVLLCPDADPDIRSLLVCPQHMLDQERESTDAVSF